VRLRKGVGLVWVSEAVLEAMEKEAREKSPMETGGVLIGYWADDSGEVVITHATGPGPEAVHRLDEFIPDAPFQRNEVARIYRDSGRLHTYLGDWHTHPRGSLRLSRRDVRTLASIGATPAARATAPLMGILAGEVPLWELAIWRYTRRRWGFLRGADATRLRPRSYRA
jgi:integrative and conjugative element protein (TIGR02256 family)